MTKIIWRLAVGFDGKTIDGGPNPGGGLPLDNNSTAGKTRYEARGDRRTNRVIGATNGSQSVQSGGLGGAIDLLYLANQVANNHVANSGESNALSALSHAIIDMMPRRSGGVLVVSVFIKSGPAVRFESSYVDRAYQTMPMAVEAYRSRGTISSTDTVTRLWWATINRPKEAPHVGPPIMRSWP